MHSLFWLHCKPYINIQYSSLSSWIYRVCISCLCTQLTETETTSISQCMTGTSSRGIERSYLSFASWATVCLLLLFVNYGAQEDVENGEVLWRDTFIHANTDVLEEGQHFKLHWRQHFFVIVFKIMSPLSSYLPLCHYLHFIRARICMTTHELEQRTDHSKRQFLLIWSAKHCRKWWNTYYTDSLTLKIFSDSF